MKRYLLLALLAACAHNDSDDGPSYPACTGASQQCLDTLVVSSDAMPFYRNISPAVENPAVTQAVIIVHAAERNASTYFFDAMTAAEQAGIDTSTIVIAPHFECDDDNPPAGQLYWACSGQDWSHGYGDELLGISSYAIIDTLIQKLADKTVFPNLTSVVVTGMASGGQFAQRYAATNQIDPVAGVAISYVPVAPSTYAWLDSTRPATTANCTGYDDYFYGLQNRSGYVATPTIEQVVDEFVARDVGYFVGDEDTLANAAGTGMDESCGANAQGIDRLARAQAFFATVQSRGAAQALTIVPGCMHDRECMYYSPEVRAAVFGAPKI